MAVFNTGGMQLSVQLAVAMGGARRAGLFAGVFLAVDSVTRGALATECVVNQGGCVWADDVARQARTDLVFDYFVR